MAITAQMVKELREMTSAGMMDCKKALAETNGDMEAAVKFLREQGLMKQEKKAGRIAAEGIAMTASSDDSKSAAIVEVNSETDFVAKNQEFVNFAQGLCELQLSGDFNEDVEALKAAKFPGSDDDVDTTLKTLIAKIGENMTLRRIAKLSVDKGVVATYLHAGGKIGVLLAMESEGDKAELEALGRDIAMQVASMNPKFISSDDVDADFIANEKEVLMQQAINEGKPANIAEKMVEGRLNKELKEVCLLEQEFVKDSDFTIKSLIADKAKALGADIKVVAFKRFEVGEGLEKKQENFAEEVAKQMK
ncbi:MAG: translation elongation factor Ts [Bacillota bacterium]|nr:translation elongation factor Ts [Bacillota bacterium]